MIKPTHKPIKGYYDTLKRVKKTGAKHEMAVRTAFQHLLEKLAAKQGWTMVPERPIKNEGHRVVPDGTVLDDVMLPRGFWEAKDTDDDLDAEIEKKRAKGYPIYNAIFEDTKEAVLYQHGHEILRKDLTDPEELCRLLTQFFAYAKPVVANFEQAVDKFKEDVPELAQSLQQRIDKAHKDNRKFKQAFEGFLELCKSSLNPNIAPQAVDEMLVQHLLTERLFRTVKSNCQGTGVVIRGPSMVGTRPTGRRTFKLATWSKGNLIAAAPLLMLGWRVNSRHAVCRPELKEAARSKGSP